MLVPRIAAAAAVAAAAATLALPAGASATTTNSVGCVVTVVENAPGFVIYTANNFVENGQLPRLMGPWLPC